MGRKSEEGFARTTKPLAHNDYNCIFEVQGAILRKLAAEENYLKGLSEVCRVRLSLEPFSERVTKAEEAITVLTHRRNTLC